MAPENRVQTPADTPRCCVVPTVWGARKLIIIGVLVLVALSWGSSPQGTTCSEARPLATVGTEGTHTARDKGDTLQYPPEGGQYGLPGAWETCPLCPLYPRSPWGILATREHTYEGYLMTKHADNDQGETKWKLISTNGTKLPSQRPQGPWSFSSIPIYRVLTAFLSMLVITLSHSIPTAMTIPAGPDPMPIYIGLPARQSSASRTKSEHCEGS